MSDVRFHLDKTEDRLVVETSQDVEDILERNKQLRATPQRSDWGRHIASIPNVFMVQWANEEYQRGNVSLQMFTKEFDELVARKLKDPEWAFLRTDCQANQFRTGWQA